MIQFRILSSNRCIDGEKKKAQIISPTSLDTRKKKIKIHQHKPVLQWEARCCPATSSSFEAAKALPCAAATCEEENIKAPKNLIALIKILTRCILLKPFLRRRESLPPTSIACTPFLLTIPWATDLIHLLGESIQISHHEFESRNYF